MAACRRGGQTNLVALALYTIECQNQTVSSPAGLVNTGGAGSPRRSRGRPRTRRRRGRSRRAPGPAATMHTRRAGLPAGQRLVVHDGHPGQRAAVGPPGPGVTARGIRACRAPSRRYWPIGLVAIPDTSAGVRLVLPLGQLDQGAVLVQVELAVPDARDERLPLGRREDQHRTVRL